MASFHQDLDNLTRDMHDKTFLVEYLKKNPILALMLERKDLTFSGGKKYERNLDVDSHEDLVQDYSNNTTLTHGVKDTTEIIKFRKKKMQCPVQIDLDEEMENAKQTPDGTQLQNLAKFRVKKANEAMRFHMRAKMYYSADSSGSKAPTDSNKFLQGLNSALEVDTTYGEQTRTFATGIKTDVGFWWQPEAGTVSKTVQDTALAISIAALRIIQEPLEDLESDNLDFVSFCGGTLWLSLLAEAESRSVPYTIEKNRVARQGFKEMILDERRIVKDPWLSAANNAAVSETTGAAGALELRYYAINLKDWDFFIHPDRNFRMSEFFDQSKIMGGTDSKLARVKFAGNLVCWKPQANLYRSNVSA